MASIAMYQPVMTNNNNLQSLQAGYENFETNYYDRNNNTNNNTETTNTNPNSTPNNLSNNNTHSNNAINGSNNTKSNNNLNDSNSRKSRRVTFYKNGDRYFIGKLVTITPNRYFSFRDLMNDLNRSVDLPYGVRRVYTPVHGREIYDIDDLVDGSSYVCASFEPFRATKYGDSHEKPWNANIVNQNRQDMNGAQMLPPINSNNNNTNNITNNNNGFNASNQAGGYILPRQYLKTIPIVTNNNGFVLSNSIKKSYMAPNSLPSLVGKSHQLQQHPGNASIAGGGAVVQSEQWSKPRLITIIRATERPRKKITILLNRKALHSFEQFVCDISDAFGLPQWKNDKIRKLFSIKGKRIQSISEFFREDDVFIGVSGKELLKGPLVRDLIQEIYPDNEEFAQNIFKEWESSRSKSRAKPRHNSVDQANNSQANTHRENYNNNLDNINEKSPLDTNTRRSNNNVNVEFDENGRRKRKKKTTENNNDAAPIDMEAQRQRERLKLIELERKKREIASMQKDANNNVNPASSNNNYQNNNKFINNRRVNILTPTSENNLNNQNNSDQLNIDTRKLRRKPKFKKSLNNDVIDEIEPGESTKTTQKHTPKIISPVNNLAEEKVNVVTPSSNRNVNNKSKSPAIPKDVNYKESRKESLNEIKENNHSNQSRPSPNNLNVSINDKNEIKAARKYSQPKAQKEDMQTRKLRRQISSVSRVTDKYEILKTLGDGNFAVVKQSKQKNTDNEYAIKIIDKSKMKGKENMIENEIYIMKSCDHPNIVKLHEEFETKDEVYLVTDLVKGGDLFDAISQSVKFSEKDSASMVQDLCEALFYMHSKKIVHRDLKPENLLVMRKKDDKISIKLADFGLAMEVTEPIFTVCGTPTYVAPEILSEIGYGLEVDMWACGVITYILLCGFPPFRSLDRNQEELFQYIQAGEFEYLMPYWEGISESSKDLINHLLVVDINKRWKAEDVLCHPWIITQGNSKPLPPNFEEYKKNYLNELRSKAKLYASEPFASKY